jgi:hypothetical protein
MNGMASEGGEHTAVLPSVSLAIGLGHDDATSMALGLSVADSISGSAIGLGHIKALGSASGAT